MQFATKVEALIGKTPLIDLTALGTGSARILGKYEATNPGGSVKDRIARAMLDAAEKDGRLAAGGTVIEPTSGNTGVGLAMLAAARGYRMILVMPDTMGQFVNPANPQAHYETTGPEVWDATEGTVDALVSGVGTGGTVSGTARFLKEHKASVKAIAVEPAESPVLSGGAPGKHRIQGIGAGFVPDTYDASVIDQVVTVTSDDAIATKRRLAAELGVLVGISSGAAVSAALALDATGEYEGKTIVAILPDTGERYLSLDA